MTPQQANWIEIGGKWTFTECQVEQTEVSDTDTAKDITRAAIDIGHKDFIATFTLTLTEMTPKGIGEAKFIISGANNPDLLRGEAYRIDFMYLGSGACRVTAGTIALISNLQLIKNRPYAVRICVKDNLLAVNVDHMTIIERFNLGTRSNGNIGFGTFKAAAIFSNILIEAYVEKKCFVIMPFDEKRNLLYDLIIVPVLKNHPFFVFDFIRADQAMTVGRISEEISKWIKEADVIIGDITEKNRNVFYELGLAHAFCKKAILLIQQTDNDLDIPFDIRDFRCHPYEFSSSGFDRLKFKLAEILGNILRVPETSLTDQ